MKTKYTSDQKLNIGSCLRIMIKNAGLSKKEIAEGAEITLTRLENFLKGKTNPSAKTIDSIIEQVDKCKLSSKEKHGIDDYYFMPSDEIIKLLNGFSEDFGYMYNQADFAAWLGVSQSKLSKMLVGEAVIDLEMQIKIIKYLDDLYFDPNDIIMFSDVTIIKRRSRLYELSDIVLRNYRYLDEELQKRLEGIMVEYMNIFIGSYLPFDRFYEKFCKAEPKMISEKLSDTLKFYNDIKGYDDILQSNEKVKEYCKNVRKAMNSAPKQEKEKYKLLMCAVSASAKKHSSLIPEDIAFAAIMETIDKKLIEYESKDIPVEFYTVLDDFYSRLLYIPISLQDGTALLLWERRNDYRSLFGRNMSRSFLTEREITDIKESEKILETFCEGEFELAEENAKSLNEELEYFANLSKGERQVIIENLPCFLGYESLKGFYYLFGFLEKCAELDEQQLEDIIDILSDLPQIYPRFGKKKALNQTDYYLQNLNDPFTEITCCRNMMIKRKCFEYDDIRKSNVTKAADEENKQIFEKALRYFCDNYDGGEIIDSLKQKLSFSSDDWYVWQLILNAYYLYGYDKLDEIMKDILSGEQPQTE